MARSGCAKEPTFSDQIKAAQYIQATSKAVASLSTPSAAVAAGYEPVSPTDYPVVYYVNPTIAAENAMVDRTLDPTSIDGLVYATTPSGDQVLAAAMYVYPSSVATPPMPYGSLVQWHQRTEVCGSAGTTAVNDSSTLAITGYPPCPAGSRCPTHPVRHNGVASSCRGWTTRNPTARHPDCRGGDDADQLVNRGPWQIAACRC